LRSQIQLVSYKDSTSSSTISCLLLILNVLKSRNSQLFTQHAQHLTPAPVAPQLLARGRRRCSPRAQGAWRGPAIATSSDSMDRFLRPGPSLPLHLPKAGKHKPRPAQHGGRGLCPPPRRKLDGLLCDGVRTQRVGLPGDPGRAGRRRGLSGGLSRALPGCRAAGKEGGGRRLVGVAAPAHAGGAT